MQNVGGSIVSILSGSNSIDTSALVTQLVAATRDPKEAVLNDRLSDNSARISALASAASSLDTFTTALKDVLEDSSFAGQPASNDPTIAGASLLPGGNPTGLPAQIEVTQLAAAQILESVNLADSTQAVGQGTLTLTTANGPQTITIDGTNDSLDGLAAAINDAEAGVIATVVTDNRGARLVLKGETGDVNAFTLTKEAGDTADAALERFTFDGTAGNMLKRQSATDSIVFIDGVEMQNDSNVLESAIPFVRIDLNKAEPGTLVTLGTTEPLTSTKELVQEFVNAFNQLRSALNTASLSGADASTAGALAGDSSIRTMKNELSKLTTTQLASSGPYRALYDIGIKTNQDGTLSLDTAKLDAAIDADPEAVVSMLRPIESTETDPGLAASVEKIRDTLQGESGPLTASKARYDALQAELNEQLTKLDEDMTSYEERLTLVYSRMASQLNAFKATQSYLEQQVAIWTNSDN